MPTLEHLPPWTVSYDYNVSPAVVRMQGTDGRRANRKVSHRRTVIANATRQLKWAELPYFEWFIRGICNEGANKFTDVYADHNGLQTGTIRLLDGAYSVSTDLRRHTVTCQLEIFR